MDSPSARTAANAHGAWRRSTKYSVWISSPLLGVESIRRCGRRSDHGPGTPRCTVVLFSPSAWQVSVDTAVAPNIVGGIDPDSPAASRVLSHATWMVSPSQSANRLTL